MTTTTINLNNLPAKIQGNLYNSSANYIVGDIVSYSNTLYICIANTTNNLPTNVTYWTALSAGVSLSRDLGVSTTNPQVVGIRGVDIQNTSPSDGYTLIYRSSNTSYNLIPNGYVYLTGVSGAQSVFGIGSNTFYGIGTIYLTTTDFPSFATYTFENIVEASSSQTAEIRLYNLTDGSVVSGSTLSTSSNTPAYISVNITPASGSKIYEVQLRITNGSPSNTDGAICKSSRLKIKLS